MNLRVNREWDWKMRLVSHVVVIVVIAFFSAMALGGPQLLSVALPLGAIAAAVEIRRLQKDRKEVGLIPPSDIAAKRRRRAVVVVASVVLFAVGWVVEGLPSQAVHDRYWFLLVAPMMIAIVVGPVALLMLGWSYLPRRDEEVTRSP